MRALILGPTSALGLWCVLAVNAAAQPGPTCVPATLNSSALKAGSVTVSPLAGSRDASAATQISFLGAPASALSAVSATGSRSGRHPGRMAAYSQGNGASFLPYRPFAEGEQVTVRARLRSGATTHTLSDRFVVAKEDPLTSTPEIIHSGRASEVQGFRSRPDLQPPTLRVTADSPATAPGDIFVAPYTGPGQAGPMILDQHGALIWFKRLPRDTSAANLSVQEYAGRPVLTWWQGDISVHGFGRGEGVIADSSYTDVAHVRAGNGEEADLHELQLTPSGAALITVYHPILCNLVSVGGPVYGAVTDGVFQVLDVRTGLVMYEWTSLDHVALDESYTPVSNSSTRQPYDFFHINSINLDRDGSLLVSARNTWTVYDVAPASGQVAWRLGGKRSSFSGSPETQIAYQHDPRELPDGLISLFDNGASPTVHSQSRGLVLGLEPGTGTAKLISQFTHTPPLISESQGNIQALANGDWFVGWGQEPDFSEYDSSGSLLFEAHFPPHSQSYRSFRLGWTGKPAHPPAFAFKPAARRAGIVYASWNGATGVASWRVLLGPRASALHAAAVAPRAGFETPIRIPVGSTGPYLAVQALDDGGRVLGSSAPARPAGLG